MVRPKPPGVGGSKAVVPNEVCVRGPRLFAAASDTDYSKVTYPTARYVLPASLRASCRGTMPRGGQNKGLRPRDRQAGVAEPRTSIFFFFCPLRLYKDPIHEGGPSGRDDGKNGRRRRGRNGVFQALALQ